MELRVLRYFLTVAREQNITRAAELLHISQPALSRQLMQLEEELVVRLFERGWRNVVLTDDGHLLFRRAREIVELAEKTENEFKDEGDALSGVVSVGCGEAESMRRLAQLMRSFSEKYPNVKFDLYSNNADYIKEGLERGWLDIGLFLEPVDLSGYEYLRIGVKERWGVIVPADSALAQKESVTARDLIGCKVFASKRALAQGIVGWFGDVYDKLDIYVTYNQIYNVAMLVDCGMGAAMCIDGAVSLYRNPNIVFRPFSPELTVVSALAWKKSQPASRAFKKFIEHLKQSADPASGEL